MHVCGAHISPGLLTLFTSAQIQTGDFKGFVWENPQCCKPICSHPVGVQVDGASSSAAAPSLPDSFPLLSELIVVQTAVGRNKAFAKVCCLLCALASAALGSQVVAPLGFHNPSINLHVVSLELIRRVDRGVDTQ